MSTNAMRVPFKKPISGLLSARVLLHLLILRPLVRVLCRVQVERLDQFASLKQFVLVANHNSHLDTLLLYLALTTSQIATVRTVAAVDYFAKHSCLYSIVNFLFRPIWIDRDASGRKALENMIHAIDNGESIILFPEGSRGVPGKIGMFKDGVGMLLQYRPGVPVVPAHVEGSDRSLPRGMTIPRFVDHRVIVGSPRFASGNRSDVACSLRDEVEWLGCSQRPGTGADISIHHRPLRIAVIGIDGCGKSTVSRQLARDLSRASTVCLVSDALEFYERGRKIPCPSFRAEAVRQWAGSRAKRARGLAAYKIPKLLELLLRNTVAGQIGRRRDADLIVMDGCPVSNLLAWSILYHERSFDASTCRQAMAVMTSGPGITKIDGGVLHRFPELALLVRFRLNRLQIPHATILLDVEPGLAVRRIGHRKERRQAHESEATLTKLRSAYLTVHRLLDRHPGVMACRLDAALRLDALVGEVLLSTRQLRRKFHA